MCEPRSRHREQMVFTHCSLMVSLFHICFTHFITPQSSPKQTLLSQFFLSVVHLTALFFLFRIPRVVVLMHPKPWLESCLRWVFGTGSFPPARWPAWLAAAKSPRAAWPPGLKTELRFTVEPPRTQENRVVNTAGALSDRRSKAEEGWWEE